MKQQKKRKTSTPKKRRLSIRTVLRSRRTVNPNRRKHHPNRRMALIKRIVILSEAKNLLIRRITLPGRRIVILSEAKNHLRMGQRKKL